MRIEVPTRFSSCKSNVAAGIYLYDEITEKIRPHSTSKFTDRTHTCGELRVSHVGQTVVLCGWLEYRRMGKFAVIRDSYGHTQLLVRKEVR